MSTLERIAEALRTQPLAAGPYSIELHDPPVSDLEYFAIDGTFRGLAPIYGAGAVKTNPSEPYEERVHVMLLHDREPADTQVELARLWATLVQRAFETMATHPVAHETWLGVQHFGTYYDHERIVARAQKKLAKNPHALRDEFEKAHPLAEFVAGPATEYARARALIEKTREENGGVLGRSGSMAFELATEGFVWQLARVRYVANLIVFEDDGAVRDIKQQEIYFAAAAHLARPERVNALLEALYELGSDRLAQLEATTEREALMPHDVFGDTDRVLELKKPVTRDDFVAALRTRWKL